MNVIIQGKMYVYVYVYILNKNLCLWMPAQHANLCSAIDVQI